MEIKEILEKILQLPISEEKKKEIITEAEGLAVRVEEFKQKYGNRTDEEAVSLSKSLEGEIDSFMQKGYFSFKDFETKLKEQIKTPERDDATVNKILTLYSINPATDYTTFDTAVRKSKMEYTLFDIQKLAKKLPIVDDRGAIGIYMSVLINNIIKPEDAITLQIKGKTTSLCCNLPHGTIILEGEIEKCFRLGMNMRGGLIEVKTKAGMGLGTGMQGGKIIAYSADTHAGDSIKGGEIEIKTHAGSYLGLNMRGGKIIVNSTDDVAGFLMTDGLIEIKTTAGPQVGRDMKGGKITVYGKAGKDAGIGRQGGIIELLGGYESIGEPAKDSKAIIKTK